MNGHSQTVGGTTAGRRLPVVGGGQFLLGHLPALRRDPIGLFLRGVATHGDIAVFPLVAGTRMTLVRSPEHVKHVLHDNVKNYSKQTRGYAALRTVLGNGLVTSEGDFWLRQRRIAQPAFHRQRIAHFADTMVQLTRDLLDRWAPLARTGETLDVAHEMMALTLRVVGRTLLSAEVSAETEAVGRSLDVVLHELIDRTVGLMNLPLVIPTRGNRALRASRAALDAIVYRMIAERRRTGEQKDDLLSMLMSARDEETGEAMSDLQLRDEVMTIFLAGHETTANALTWTFHLLSKHPGVREKLKAEVDEVLAGRMPAFDDLPRLRYTAMVINEAMRLYPPVWILMRRSESTDEIGGVPIPARSFVAVSAYVSHRNPNVFEDPERFDPERFSPERAQALPRFAYFPFSGGPRICIGNNFALMEAQLVLAAVTQWFKLEMAAGHPVALDPTVTLRPKFGMKMKISPW